MDGTEERKWPNFPEMSWLLFRLLFKSLFSHVMTVVHSSLDQKPLIVQSLSFCFARLHIHTHTSSSMPVMFLFINLCTIHIGGSQDCPGSGYLKMGSPQLIMNRKWKLIWRVKSRRVKSGKRRVQNEGPIIHVGYYCPAVQCGGREGRMKYSVLLCVNV